MKPNFRLYTGETLTVLKTLPSASIDSVVSSPPYYRLRDYQFPEQYGLEPDFRDYLESLWRVMDELWRILKPTGTAWINLGDTYNNPSKWGGASGNKQIKGVHGTDGTRQKVTNGLPERSLMLIPHRFAIGCQDRGWCVKNDIVWAKRNGLPESVKKRFCKKHEYFFFMTKDPSRYYFDLDSVRTDYSDETKKRVMRAIGSNKKFDAVEHLPMANGQHSLNKPVTNRGYDKMDEHISNGDTYLHPNGKNPGDVSDYWDIPVGQNKNDHHATYPTKLIHNPIVAGSPKGGIVLDMFCGSGTTGIEAMKMGRNFWGIDGNPKYIAEAKADLMEVKYVETFF